MKLGPNPTFYYQPPPYIIPSYKASFENLHPPLLRGKGVQEDTFAIFPRGYFIMTPQFMKI